MTDKVKLTPFSPFFNNLRKTEGLDDVRSALSSKDFKNKAAMPELILKRLKPALTTLLNLPDETGAKAKVVDQLESMIVDLSAKLSPEDGALQAQLMPLIQNLQAPDADKATLLSNFLDQHLVPGSPLLKLMAEALPEYLAENLDNLERLVHNLSKQTGKILETQAQHAAYLQGWERVGMMLGLMVFAVGQYLVAEAKGVKLDVDLESDGGGRPGVVPIPMKM